MEKSIKDYADILKEMKHRILPIYIYRNKHKLKIAYLFYLLKLVLTCQKYLYTKLQAII